MSCICTISYHTMYKTTSAIIGYNVSSPVASEGRACLTFSRGRACVEHAQCVGNLCSCLYGTDQFGACKKGDVSFRSLTNASRRCVGKL